MRVLAGRSMKFFVLLKVSCVFLLAGFDARPAFSAVFNAGAILERCRYSIKSSQDH